jgi:hypothetical protein
MDIEVNIRNDDYDVRSDSTVGELVKKILADVRKQKASFKMALNTPVGTITLTVDKPTALDYYFRGTLPYDIMGAAGASKMVFRSKWGNELDRFEEYARWCW